MGDGEIPPEWAGYLAAFECYLEAVSRGDDDTAGQARELMSRFTSEIRSTRAPRRNALRGEAQIRALLEFLDRP